MVPTSYFHGSAKLLALLMRLGLSLIYALDLIAQIALAEKRDLFIRKNWPSIGVVIFPALRIVASVRVYRRVFRRGQLHYLIYVSVVILFNLAVIVFLFERGAPGSKIRSLGDAIWWVVVTATTVGYGDYVTVTTVGKLAAVAAMVVGIVTVAVITATVAANFLSSSSGQPVGVGKVDDDIAGEDKNPDPSPAIDLIEVVRRLDHLQSSVDTLVRRLEIEGGKAVE